MQKVVKNSTVQLKQDQNYNFSQTSYEVLHNRAYSPGLSALGRNT